MEPNLVDLLLVNLFQDDEILNQFQNRQAWEGRSSARPLKFKPNHNG